jgi:hypothetical protein
MAPKRISRPRDPLQFGRLIVGVATEQVEDGKGIVAAIEAREGAPKERGLANAAGRSVAPHPACHWSWRISASRRTRGRRR